MAEGGERRRPARIGGYDTDLSIEPIKDELICAICTGILRDPMMVNQNKCGHTYCKDCIEQQMRGSRACPNCRDPIPEDGCIVKAPPMVQRLVKGIKVRCMFAFGDQNDFPHGKPCGWEGDLADFDGHVDGKCIYGEKECVQGCGEFIARILAVRHEENDCNQTDVVCVFPGCGAKMKRCQLEEHMAASGTVHFIPLLGMVTGLKEKVETLERNEINLQAKIVALQEEAATHQQHEEALKVTVEALDKTVTEHKQKETDLNATMKAHEQSLMKQQEEEVLLKATLETLEGKLAAQEQKETALTAAVQAHKKSLETQRQKEMMLAATVEKLQGKVATHEQKETARDTKLEAVQRKVATQEQTHGRQAVVLQGKVTTLEEKERELDVSLSLLRARILQATASHLHQFKNALAGTISSNGKSCSFRVDYVDDDYFFVDDGYDIYYDHPVLSYPVDITGALEVGKPLEMTILQAASALIDVTFKCTSPQGKSTNLTTRELAEQSKVRVMLSKDGVLAVLRCGDDALSCGWPLDAPTTVRLSFRVTTVGEYAINLF